MVSCFSDTSIKLPFNWEHIQIGESFTHALSSISFSNFFGTHKTDVCLEWLLLCGLLTWRQLYRFFVTKGGCGCATTRTPLPRTEWQMTSTWITKRWYTNTVVCHSHTFNSRLTFRICYANFRAPFAWLCLLCVFYEDDDGRSYQMNNIFKQYQCKENEHRICFV